MAITAIAPSVDELHDAFGDLPRIAAAGGRSPAEMSTPRVDAEFDEAEAGDCFWRFGALQDLPGANSTSGWRCE